ncbi:MAG: adenine phosphoribosyltransferase [Pseudomonadota bacterium]
MTRDDFHRLFETPGPVVLPVIHVLDEAQTLSNLDLALDAGAVGVFLINHDFGIEPFLPLIRAARRRAPEAWIGVNFLAVTGLKAFPILGELAAEGLRVDAYWADDARIDEAAVRQDEAEAITTARQHSGWDGLYFGGTAFKKQRPVAPADWTRAASIAAGCMDVVTTSGVATGEAAADGKIAAFRAGLRDRLGDHPLALASGITPENAWHYRDVDAFMVATGINRPGDFYRIEPARLTDLLNVAREIGG